MSVFVRFEARLLEVHSFVNKTPILSAYQETFRHRHIDATSIDEGASCLFTQRSRSWREEHRAPSPQYEWRHDFDCRHLERRKFHDGGAGHGMGVCRHVARSATELEGLVISEIIIVPL